jgi:membrane protease YdiL (CAAX protease family)
MDAQSLNRVSSRVVLVLSVTALLAVLAGYAQPLQADEGALAHVFQLAIVALMAGVALFLATLDWKQPLRSARPLAVPAAVLVLAFGALYSLEHFR